MEAFIAASRLITGEERLDEQLAARYAEAMKQPGGGAAALAALLDVCANALQSQDPPRELKAAVSANAAIAETARQLAHLWFAGALPPSNGKPQNFLGPEAYFGGLLWRVVGAHPPGLSGGYFGYWRYPPDA